MKFVSTAGLIYIRLSCHLLLFVIKNDYGNAKIVPSHTKYKNHFNAYVYNKMLPMAHNRTTPKHAAY
jgi:hypothetical protein